jgi:hypothetical protein
MKKTLHRGLTAALLVGLGGLLLAGCGSDSTPVVTNEIEELNLTDDFGGYKATDQPPGFGDPEIMSSMTEDEAAPLFVGDSVGLDSLYGNPRFTLYTVAVRWGQLEGDSTVTTKTDWSGTASLVRGHLKLLRVLRFERGQDSIVRPRPGPLEISWVSKTSVHFDGLAFMIVDPLYPDDELGVESSFTFSTEPYSATFNLDDLADLDTVITVDGLGNQVAITAHRIKPDPCGKGFMEGVWWPNNHLNKMGKFHGKWIADDGSLAGHVRGHWGQRGNGERVLFGQWIDRSGVFKGFLRGVWGPDPNRPGHGFFRGSIFERDKTEIGGFRGDYILPRNDHSRGFFHGGWKLNCPEEETEP